MENFLIIFVVGVLILKYSRKCKLYTINIFTGIEISIISISTIFFHLRPEKYNFQGHRQYDFSTEEMLKVLIPALMFILTLIILENTYSMFYKVEKIDKLTNSVPKPIKALKGLKGVKIKITIYALVLISIIVKVWMFEMSIGIVGVESPMLAFKLSGILVYSYGYIVPIAINYLLIKLKHIQFMFGVTLLMYGLIIGIASSSKGVYFISTIGVILISFKNKKYNLGILSILFSGVAIWAISASREMVNVVINNVVIKDEALDYYTLLINIWDKFDINAETILIFIGIINRVESFQDLLLASRFDSIVLGGGGGIFLKYIYNPIIVFDHSAIHMEYFNYVPPIGYYNISGSPTVGLLMTVSDTYWYILLFAIYIFLVCVTLEKNVRKLINNKKNIDVNIIKAILILNIILLMTFTGSVYFWFVWLVSVLIPNFLKLRI